jgi:hypothetical protein
MFCVLGDVMINLDKVQSVKLHDHGLDRRLSFHMGGPSEYDVNVAFSDSDSLLEGFRRLQVAVKAINLNGPMFVDPVPMTEACS